uniref:Uncharacterized protein n=1 Tax=Anguilla anguilla TaxID=7936 RepID=A0A0E9PMI9_ANGAN
MCTGFDRLQTKGCNGLESTAVLLTIVSKLQEIHPTALLT